VDIVEVWFLLIGEPIENRLTLPSICVSDAFAGGRVDVKQMTLYGSSATLFHIVAGIETTNFVEVCVCFMPGRNGGEITTKTKKQTKQKTTKLSNEALLYRKLWHAHSCFDFIDFIQKYKTLWAV
jgi:hypothetical protein